MDRMGDDTARSRRRGSRRRPTIVDIAHEVGVSPSLVSLVLSGRSGPNTAAST